MKLLCIDCTDIVLEGQQMFGFKLPSEHLEKVNNNSVHNYDILKVEKIVHCLCDF